MFTTPQTAAHGGVRRPRSLRDHLRRHHDHHLRRNPAGRTSPVRPQGLHFTHLSYADFPKKR